MDGSNRYYMSTVLLIEIVEVGLMLEVVCIAVAAFNNIVRLYIVGELYDVEGYILLSEDGLDNAENLCMGRGRSCDLDGLTLECIVVNRRIKAIGRVGNNTYDVALVGLFDVVLYLLARSCRNKRLCQIGALIALLNRNDVGVCGIGALDSERILCGREICGDSVVGVDNCE